MKVENFFQVKLGTFLRKPQKDLEVHKQSPTMNVSCVVGNHKVEQCPHERKFSLGTDTTSSDSKEKLPDGKSRSVDYPKTPKKATYNLEASPVSQWNNKPSEI